MKPNEQVIRKVNEGTALEHWEIDAVGNCGNMVFPNVVTVIDPKTTNPGISFRGTTGLRGVKKSIRLIEKERKKFGLTTLQ